MLHGLAGSSALLLLVVSTMTSRWLGLANIAIFGVGSVVGMAMLSAIIAWPLGGSVRRLVGAYIAVEWLIGIGTIAIGVSMMR